MGQYEPNDSRDVTLNSSNNPIEPERTGPRENETRQDEQGQKERRSSDPTQTNEPQAIKNASGVARPFYDQYEVNQPGNMNAQADADAEPVTQAGSHSGDEKTVPEDGAAQPGYGNARNAEGRMEQDQMEQGHTKQSDGAESDADLDKTPSGYTQMRQQQQQTTQAPGNRGDGRAASPPQVSHDMPEEDAEHQAIPGEIAAQPDVQARADANPAVMQER